MDKNPSRLFYPIYARSILDVEKYCTECGQYTRAGGICKKHCAQRKRLLKQVADTKISENTAKRIAARRNSLRNKGVK